MRIRLLLLFSAAVAACAQDDPKDLLLQVRHKVIETLDGLPKYVCTQTVERAQYRLHNGIRGARSCDDVKAERNAGHIKRRLLSTDRLRFDVASGLSHEEFGLSDEMYSWVGDQHFHDPGLLDLVRQGAISTGSFSSFLISLFGEDRASFSYNGDHLINGRLLSEFGFRVPLEESNYVYRYGNKRTEVLTAYDGTFLVDPKTVDLVRLVVRQDLPPETDACEAIHTVDYGRVKINDANFLLVTDATLNILTRTIEAENRIAYSACHEFVGQSTLTFGPSPEPSRSGVPTKNNSAISVFALPRDLSFTVAFTEKIDTAVAAAGDPIKAKLTTAISGQSSKVLVPEGAVISGHIVEIKHFSAPPSLVIGVKLETVEVGGKSQSLRVGSDSGVRRWLSTDKRGLSTRAELGPLDLTDDREVGIFRFRDAGPNYVIKRGFRSVWLTLVP